MSDLEKLEAELLRVYRKLAAAELDARLGWGRYKAENVKLKAKETELLELKYNLKNRV